MTRRLVSPAITGMSGLSGIAGGLLAPPVSTSYLAYYEASRNATLSSSPAANYGKVDSWLPVTGSGSLVQATDANRMRLRTTSGFKEVIYQDQSEASRTLADSTVSIDKQACTIFMLVEIGSLIVNGVAESQTLISIPTAGTTGELYLYKAATSRYCVAWKDGTGTYVSALEPSSSLNLIGVTLSTGSVVVHCNGSSETLGAAALSAGSVTGFRLNYGTLLYGEQAGYHAVVLYGKALSVGEVAEVVTWGRNRGAIYPADSDVTQQLYACGASRAVGYYPSGNISHGRRIAAANPKRLYRIGAFGGISISALLTRARLEYGLLGEGGSYPVGSRWQNYNKRQTVVIEIPTADTTSSVASATQITNLTLLRQEFRCSGYDVLMNALAPVQSWSGAQQTIASEVNVAMAALDERRYGKFHSLPSELSDASNTTYFNADGTHYTLAGYQALYNDNSVHIEGMLGTAVPSIQGYWSLNGDLLDNSGYNFDLQVINSPSFVTGLNGGQALRCTATGSHAARYYAPTRTWDTLPLTIVGWFQVRSATGSDYIFVKSSASGGAKNWYIYRHNTSGTIRAAMTGTTAECNSGGSYAVGSWYGFALIMDATNGQRLYLTDAGGDPATFALKDTKAWSAGAVTPSAASGVGQLRVGCINDTGCYNVDAQGMRIYFAEKSLAELQAMTPEGSDL